MGSVVEGHIHLELENGVKLGLCGHNHMEVDSDVEEEQPVVDLSIEEAVKVLLQGLGEDINREGIIKTPLRVAKALREGTRGYKQKVNDIIQGALFPEVGVEGGVGHAGGVGGLVLVRDLNLYSYCESCLLPFQVKCHVGYVPSGHRVIGLSKLSRVADMFAKRLQNPQRLADEVCSALQHGIKPAGVAVVIQCSHVHFPNFETAFFDSNHQGLVKALNTSGSGVFENEKADVWSDLLSLLKFSAVDVKKMRSGGYAEQSWCPWSLCKMVPGNSGMTAAVVTILQSLGEDPQRKELVGTPTRFLKWLMNFKNSNLDLKLNGCVLNGGVGSLASNGDVKHNEERIQSELNLSFWSQCEHHLLPFYGVAHIGYICGDRVNPMGKSLLQSMVHFYGFKLQVQERLTRQIAETASSILGGDIMVVVEANHTCMVSRGIEKFGSSTATIAVLGRFSTDSSARAKFLQSIPQSTDNL